VDTEEGTEEDFGVRKTRRIKEKLDTEAGREKYQNRRQTVEPAFGVLKEVMGLRKFLSCG